MCFRQAVYGKFHSHLQLEFPRFNDVFLYYHYDLKNLLWAGSAQN